MDVVFSQGSSSQSPNPVTRRRFSAAGLGCLLLIPLLSGCGSDGYPADLTYGLRQDPIVVKVPDSQPGYPILPGRLEESIAHLGDEGGEVVLPSRLDAARRQELNKALTEAFGTPAKPKVFLPADHAESEGYQKAVGELALSPEHLEAGSKLYRRHCLHCHGVTGDGRGPTGPWVSPHPRDYRKGEFKFISTSIDVPGRKPRRADLLRTLRQGIEGTSMPSFALLPEQELLDLTSYIIHLSLRGEVEYDVMRNVLTGGVLEGDTVPSHVQYWTYEFLRRWQESNTTPMITPSSQPAYVADPDHADFAAAVERGYKLFTDSRGAASCISCHQDFGRQVNFRYDSWGTLVRPANLTREVYRGGRRPIDFYWRVRGGIVPSGMPAVAKDFPEENVWDLVTFVQALPYPELLPSSVRDKIYGGKRPAEAVAHR